MHTSYLSFFLHRQNFWRLKFTPKKRVNYTVNCQFFVNYTVNCQFFALNLKKFTPDKKNLHGRRPWRPWQTRSSWFNCALRDDEAVHWVIIGHYDAVEVGNWLYWVSRGHSCLYILHKVEIWTGVTHASLTHSQMKDRATQLLRDAVIYVLAEFVR